MADRIFIIPMEESIGPRGLIRTVKYLPARGVKAGAMDYGSEDVALVVIPNTQQADIDFLALQSDVITIPENPDSNMTAGQVSAAVSFYDSLNIPSDWINTNRTVRQVVQITAGLFQFNQRWRGQSATRQSSPFKEGLNLDTQYNQLSDLNKARVLMVFESMAISTSSLTATSTIRDAMREFALQIIARPLKIGGVVI